MPDAVEKVPTTTLSSVQVTVNVPRAL